MRRKFQNVISLIVILIISTTFFAACGSNGTSRPGAVKLINANVLTVCTDVSYPPFEYFDEDNLTPIGADIDLIKEVADRLGLEVRFINHAFDGIFDELGTRYDVVCSACTITEERLENMLFSVPYIDNYQCAVVLASGGMEMLSFDDLDGTVVAVKKGTTAEEVVEDINNSGRANIKMVTSEQSKGCFEMLEAGEVNAVICDSTLAAGMIKSSGGVFAEAYRNEGSPEEFAIAISKDNSELKGAIDEVLIQMELDGTTKSILDKWIK